MTPRLAVALALAVPSYPAPVPGPSLDRCAYHPIGCACFYCGTFRRLSLAPRPGSVDPD